MTKLYEHQPLPLNKLRGVPPRVRSALKARRITTCIQLLNAADQLDHLASTIGIDIGILLELVHRADMSRVNGLGVVFGMMLEDLGVGSVQALAEHDAAELHKMLRQHNQQERLARRSPTLEEVEGWVQQAKNLDKIEIKINSKR